MSNLSSSKLKWLKFDVIEVKIYKLYLLLLLLEINNISVAITGIAMQNIHTILLNSKALFKSNINKLFTALVIPT